MKENDRLTTLGKLGLVSLQVVELGYLYRMNLGKNTISVTRDLATCLNKNCNPISRVTIFLLGLIKYLFLTYFYIQNITNQFYASHNIYKTVTCTYLYTMMSSGITVKLKYGIEMFKTAQK
jgi:hypothetical protein